MRRFVAVDLETTGLDPERHQVIEVGLAGERLDGSYFEDTFSLPFNESDASPEALAINGWGKRPFPKERSRPNAQDYLEEVLRDVHIVGKNPQFDVGFLIEAIFCRPTWHHRLVDVGPLAWGYHEGHWREWQKNQRRGPDVTYPPNVDEVAQLMQIPRETMEGSDGKQYHTALQDAKWAWEVFRTIVPAS